MRGAITQCLFLIYGVKLLGRNSDWAGGCDVSLTAVGFGQRLRGVRCRSRCHVLRALPAAQAAQQHSLLASVVRGVQVHVTFYMSGQCRRLLLPVHGLAAASS